jgi:hypothetical protein
MKKFAILVTGMLFAMPACAGGTAPQDIAPLAEAPIATATTAPDPTATNNANLPTPTATMQPVQGIPSGVLAAGPSATPPQSPTMTPSPLPTATVTPTPNIDWATVTGRTTEGLNYLGNPRAPVTMIDFSDFM